MKALAYAIRRLKNAPSFTIVVVLTLALGIGVNLAVLSLVNGLFLRPLPVLKDIDGLLTIGSEDRGGGFDGVSFPNYVDLRQGNSVFTDLAAFAESPFHLSAGNATERVIGEMVSANYFRTLGVGIEVGRDFLPEEDEVTGRNPVAIISHRLWQRQWNGDSSVIGKPIVINGHPFTIIGVAAKDFRGYQLPTAHDVWVPLRMAAILQAAGDERFSDRQFVWLRRLVGRLKPEARLEDANANLAVISRRFEDAYPAENKDRRFRAFAYSPFPVVNKSGPRIFASVLVGMTVLVLLVVCANVASLFVSRTLTRQRESALKLALGSSQARLIGQVLAEGIIVAGLGAGLGLLIATKGASLLLSQIPGEGGERVAIDLGTDWRLVSFAMVLALLCTLGVGLLPALQAIRVNVLSALRSGGSTHSSERSRLRSALVTVQVALSVVLMVASGLMFRSLNLLHGIEPGMRLENLIVANLDLKLNGYTKERARVFCSELLDRLHSSPEIESASFAVLRPFGEGNMSRGKVYGGTMPESEAISCNFNRVGPGYFRTTGITLLRGREFLPEMERDSRSVIVNHTLAEKLWPNSDALGQLFRVVGSGEESMQVVGVVSDSIYNDLATEAEQRRPFYYQPLDTQISDSPLCVHVRTSESHSSVLQSVRQNVAGLDPHLPLFRVQSLKALRDESFWQQRVAAGLVTCSGALAMVLATIGLYAALSQDVSRRTREIGIRLAIGGNSRNVMRLVLRQGMKLAGIGLGFGFAAALGTSHVLKSLLYGVGPVDLLTFGLSGFLLMVVALLACWLPASRAANVDPVNALRQE